MKKILILSICLFLPLSSEGQHHVDYRISALGNLVYQLDCLTQVARFRCSHPSFKQLWYSEITPNEKDAYMLKKWAELREKINKTISLTEDQSQQHPTTFNHPANAANKINLLEKIRIIAMSSQKDNYLATIGTIVSSDYANSESQVINHFQPRFDDWFNQQKPGLEAFVNEANELGKKAHVSELLTSLRHFYLSKLPEKMTLPVYLIAHPKKQAPTSGLVFAENSIIEVLKDEKAQNRLGVVIHEIAHFYHERAPKKLHQLMMNHFVVNDSLTGKVGYYLLNEAMATAIGNGLFEERIKDEAYFQKYLAYPMSFYSDEGIDAAAKSAMNLVKQTIESKKSIDQNFLNQLDKIWDKELATIKNKPKERYGHVGLILLHDAANELVNHILGLIKPTSAHMNTMEDVDKPNELIINQFTHLDTIIVAQSWEQIRLLELDDIPTKKEQDNYKKIIHLPNNTVRLVLISQSKDFIKKQIEEVINQETF